jgi:polynucleotide 5'-kinase involved in rRNA processing
VKRDKYKSVRQALHVGQKLSNVAFNMVQSDEIPEDWQKTLDELRREWDAVATEARRAVAPRKRRASCRKKKA